MLINRLKSSQCLWLSLSAVLWLGIAGLVLLASTTSVSAQSTQNQNDQDDLAFWEEFAFWETVKDSTDPSELEAYLQTYPEGRFVKLAQGRLAKLRQQADAPETPITDSGESYIVTRSANIRQAPSTSSAKVGFLKKDQQVLVTGTVQGGSWYRIQLEGGASAYIFASLLEKAAGSEQQSSANVIQDCPECPKLVTIQPGEFSMGSEQRSDEKPIHSVTISQAYAIGMFEVSNAEWQACVDAGACRNNPASGQSPNLPVSNISWDDAQQYLTWLSKKTGASYRFPTEAEWEYAARASTSSTFWWGDAVESNQANCKDCGSQWDNKGPAPVGSFQANPFGLYDVHGNVWEWTADCWNGSHRGAPADGKARTSGDCIARIIRGGAWKLDADYMRSSRRSKYDRDVRYYLNGLRVVKTLP